MPIAAVILALVLIGAIVGGATVLGAPVFALPILAVLLAGWALYALGRRVRRRSPREDAPIAFTEEDRATLVRSPTPQERRRNRRDAARSVRR